MVKKQILKQGASPILTIADMVDSTSTPVNAGLGQYFTDQFVDEKKVEPGQESKQEK